MNSILEKLCPHGNRVLECSICDDEFIRKRNTLIAMALAFAVCSALALAIIVFSR